MAEVIGVASGVAALVTFALQASIALHNTVNGLRSNKKVIRVLREELEALSEVLRALSETLTNRPDDFTALKLPLRRCAEVCNDFRKLVESCTSQSGSAMSSIRDWTKLTFMGDDITGFKDMISAYKATISIALGHANLRNLHVTEDVLREYQRMIADTTTDLQDHLDKIETRIEELARDRGQMSAADSQEQQRQVQEEKRSTEQCLAICAQISAQVTRCRPQLLDGAVLANTSANVGAIALMNRPASARQITDDVLREIEARLEQATRGLQTHARALDSLFRSYPSFSASASTSSTTTTTAAAAAAAADDPTQAGVQANRDSLRKCLDICAEASEEARSARTNVFEDFAFSTDTRHVLVSTVGDLITARRVNVGARSAVWMGQMSDLSLQQLSRDLRLPTEPQGPQPAGDAHDGPPADGDERSTSR